MNRADLSIHILDAGEGTRTTILSLHLRHYSNPSRSSVMILPVMSFPRISNSPSV